MNRSRVFAISKPGRATQRLTGMRRIARIASGSTLLLAGTIMLVTPGPGLLTMAAGLSVLAKDVPAAARLKDKLAARIRKATRGTSPGETTPR